MAGLNLLLFCRRHRTQSDQFIGEDTKYFPIENVRISEKVCVFERYVRVRHSCWNPYHMYRYWCLSITPCFIHLIPILQFKQSQKHLFGNFSHSTLSSQFQVSIHGNTRSIPGIVNVRKVSKRWIQSLQYTKWSVTQSWQPCWTDDIWVPERSPVNSHKTKHPMISNRILVQIVLVEVESCYMSAARCTMYIYVWIRIT